MSSSTCQLTDKSSIGPCPLSVLWLYCEYILENTTLAILNLILLIVRLNPQCCNKCYIQKHLQYEVEYEV